MSDLHPPAWLLEPAAACKAASGPDRALDHRIHAALKRSMAPPKYSHPLAYTGSIDAAMTAVPDGWTVVLFRFVDGRGYCTLHHATITHAIEPATCATPALAVIAMSLETRAAILVAEWLALRARKGTPA